MALGNLGNLGSGGKPKSSLFGAPAAAPAAAPKPAPAPAAAPKPAPAPAPAPKPAPAPAPAAADPEATTGFKQRMDAFEKKLSEQLKNIVPAAPIIYPPPPPRTGEIEVLNKKIDEMERHLSDFSQSAASSAAQLKSIGESAHREFSDLFKLVREHQKYSELDRQMHGQLERAWVRAEELEKKLMDFYSSVLTLETRRREDADRASDKTAAAIELLARRLEGFEKSVSESSPAEELRAAQEKFFVSAREEAQRQAAAQEAFRAEIAASVDKLVLSTPAGELRAAQDEFFARAREEERRQAAAREASRSEMEGSLKESSRVFKEIFENYVRKELEQLRGDLSGETEALRRELAAAADESRKFLREQSVFASGKAEKFEEIARANVVKAEGVDGALAAAARSQAAALDEFSRRLRSEISAMNAEFSAAVKAENDARFGKFGAKYADALRSVTFVENFSAALSESLDKFENYGAQLESFLKEASPAQLEKASGVSGMMVRRQLGAMSGMLETLKAEAARLREIKRGVEEKFTDIFKER